MNEVFDDDVFLRKTAHVIKSLWELLFNSFAAKIDALRLEYEMVTDPEASLFIDRILNRELLLFAVHTSQSCECVDRLYDRCRKQGFVEPHAEVSSAIDYSYYCYERGNHAKGLSAVQEVRKALCSNNSIDSYNLPNFLNPIDTWVAAFEEAMRNG